MVVFTCNSCGDSLKKNKVDPHLRQCRTSSLTCVDCQADFNFKTYASHFECITEDQKYGGLNYKQQEFKGKSKQNDWVQKIKNLISENQFPKDVQDILRSLINYDNIPRKKPKFANFIKNSFRIRNDQLISKIWDIFETSIKNDNNQTNSASTNGNTASNEKNDQSVLNGNGLKRNIEDTVTSQNETTKKAKVEPELTVDALPNAEEEKPGKIKMKRVVKDILAEYNEMSVSKLRKKVLKFYHKNGFTDDSDICKKFEKIIRKDKFVINDNIISFAH